MPSWPTPAFVGEMSVPSLIVNRFVGVAVPIPMLTADPKMRSSCDSSHSMYPFVADAPKNLTS